MMLTYFTKAAGCWQPIMLVTEAGVTPLLGYLVRSGAAVRRQIVDRLEVIFNNVS
jgi:hypothetical protein